MKYCLPVIYFFTLISYGCSNKEKCMELGKYKPGQTQAEYEVQVKEYISKCLNSDGSKKYK